MALDGNPYGWDPNRPNFKVRSAHVEERLTKRKAVRSAEDAEKKKVRGRDLPCRFPRCEHVRHGYRPEVAHLDDKGMGGDSGVRTSAELMMRLCLYHHQGPVSLHSGDIRVEYLTSDKANGPCAFHQRIGETDKWFEVARELAVNGPYESRD